MQGKRGLSASFFLVNLGGLCDDGNVRYFVDARRLLDHFPMSTIRRILVVLFVVFASATVARAADYYASVEWTANGGFNYYSTQAGACNMTGAATNIASRTPIGVWPGLGPWSCKTVYTNGSENLANMSNRTTTTPCPYGGTMNSSIPRMCIGGSGPPPDCTPGPAYKINVKFPRDTLFPKRDGSCVVEIVQIVSCYHPTSGPEAYVVNYCTYLVKKTGVAASGTPASNEPVPAPVPTVPVAPSKIPPTKTPGEAPGGACPVGSVAAGVDSTGITICVGTGTAPPPATSSTTQGPPIQSTLPDGSTVTSQTTTTKNTDGSTTSMTSTVTVAPDGTTSTTKSGSTSQTPAGADGNFDSDPDNKNDFCKQNPMLSICRNSTVSGTCEAIACEGDAIQCAVLRAQAAMECRDKTDREQMAVLPAKLLGDQIAAGGDPMKAQIDAALKTGTEVDLSQPNLDASGFIGGGACISNKTFNLLGRSVPVSFSAACDSIQPLRYVILAAAYIFAYLIVSKSVLST